MLVPADELAVATTQKAKQLDVWVWAVPEKVSPRVSPLQQLALLPVVRWAVAPVLGGQEKKERQHALLRARPTAQLWLQHPPVVQRKSFSVY